jgi:hypothetical protein
MIYPTAQYPSNSEDKPFTFQNDFSNSIFSIPSSSANWQVNVDNSNQYQYGNAPYNRLNSMTFNPTQTITSHTTQPNPSKYIDIRSITENAQFTV